MLIGTRPISPDHPPYIIAELGVNHDGSPARALELVQLAADAGADAIKLQLFEADRLMSKAAKLAAYQKAAGERDPIDMLRRLELSIDDMKPCVDLAHKLGIHAIVSVFSVELVPVAERLPWDAYKTASPDIINKPLLDALAATGKPHIVSTGASTMEEVERAVEWLRRCAGRRALLQCVSSYPTELSSAEVGGISAIQSIFHEAVGYSDHTDGLLTGGVAVECGACILEKHFTWNRLAPGPDHAASLDASAFREYVDWANSSFLHESVRSGALWEDSETTNPINTRLRPFGDDASRYRALARRQSLKRVLPIEQDVRTVSRQSLTTTRPLPPGHTLTRADLTIKRPGTGIPPYELDTTIGRTLARSIEGDMPLVFDDLQR